jgi:uncharacterized protein (TIGR03382 family)
MIRLRGGCALVALLAGTAPAAAQETLLAGPGEPGHDAALEQKMDGFYRQIHALLAVELGWGLEANVADAGHRQVVADFIASGSSDFEAQTGLHPYEVVSRYDEYGDLGMFGGVQLAGDVFRYAVLRDSGAPQSVLDPARAELVRGLKGLHWYHQVTGVPGVVARGIRRRVPEAGDPPLPEPPPETVPLFDGSGDPQPAEKTATWRADNSGELPFLIWLDDSSKDQLDGWVFAVGVAWDLLADDPSIPKDALDDLRADAAAVGHSLMQKRPIGSFETDLVMMDADGRPTTFHDLSAEEISPGVVFNTPTNGFNAWMALGIVRTLYHVSGDEQIGRFYYDDLIGERDYLGVAEESVSLMYVGNQTNFSNVNMAFVAAWGLLRYEADPEIAERARRILEEQLYAPGKPREARGLKQTFFDLVFAGFRRFGVLADGGTAREQGLETLVEHAPAPYFTFGVDNCDAAEQQTLSCIGVDGTPIELSPEPGRGGALVAVDPVPMRIRPPSNFEWRSDPHRVNGGAGDRLNPGGEVVCAYWMGRHLEASADPAGMGNVSPRALSRPAGTGGTGAGGSSGGSSGAESADESGCGCTTPRPGRTSWASLALLLAWLGRRRRQSH